MTIHRMGYARTAAPPVSSTASRNDGTGHGRVDAEVFGEAADHTGEGAVGAGAAQALDLGHVPKVARWKGLTTSGEALNDP